MTAKRVWLITGCSRGFGLALAKVALEHGNRVIATARHREDIPMELKSSKDVFTVDLDVTQEDQISDAVRVSLEAFGNIDILVNNAGYGMIGAIEETTREEVRAIFDVNVLGLISVTRAVLPAMRARQCGHIINVSSAAGYGASPGWGVYGATKWAVEGLSQTMALELGSFGIKVSAVALDSYDTGFMKASHRTATQIEAYAKISAVARLMAARAGSYGQKDVRRAADIVFRATLENEVPLNLPVGSLALRVGRAAVSRFSDDLERWAELALLGEHDQSSHPNRP